MKNYLKFDIGVAQLDDSIKRKTIILVPAKEDLPVEAILPKLLILDNFVFLGNLERVPMVPGLFDPDDIFMLDESCGMYTDDRDVYECDTNTIVYDID